MGQEDTWGKNIPGGSVKTVKWACARHVQGRTRRPGPRGSEETEEDFVGCSGKFGSLREMRTLENYQNSWLSNGSHGTTTFL